jgi:O-antigen/teichoic acid export membrane protein
MTSSQRMLFNTLATFARSILAAGLALFSSRWILNALGQTDFGLFALVGSLIAFATILNGVLGDSAGRFFAFAIGKGDFIEVNKWFNTSIVIHTILPVILVSISWPIGEYCISHIFTIPTERINTSILVFRLSLIATFIVMLAVPYIAMFSSKQHIAETAFWGLLQAILTFFLAFNLSCTNVDRLLAYTIGMVGITIFITLIQVFRAISIFPECRITRRHLFSRKRTLELFGFASWSLIGCFGGILRNQGTAILLNLFHGPNVNAAYGIANQVSTQSGTFAQSMISAMSPEIATVAGRNDHQRFFDLTFRASKFGTLLTLLFTIPLFIEMDYILWLWLKTPPPHTATFCQIILLSFLVDKLSVGHMIAINANRKIAAYQSSVGIILLLTFPLAYLLLKLFNTPDAALIAFLITSFGSAIGRVYWGKHLLAISPCRWFMDVVFRCSQVALPTAFFAMLPQLLLPPSFSRLGLCLLFSLVATIIFGWFFGLTIPERDYFKHSIQTAFTKVYRDGQSGGRRKDVSIESKN